jgi:hypothetical protein
MKDRVIPLHLGVTDFDSLNNGDLQNYELEIYEDDNYGYKRNNLTVTLAIERGNIDVFARFCALKDNDCPPISIEETKMPGVDKLFAFHAVSEGKDRISFSPKCPNAGHHCFVQIAVRGGSRSHDSSKYGITAKRDEFIVHLLENKAYESHVSKDTVQIFKFYLEDENQDAEYLKVTVNVDVEFYGAKHDFCFDRSLSCSLEHTVEGSKTLPLIWRKKDFASSLGDVYYFFVVATKTTNYQIYPEVKRSFNNTPVVPKLSEGKLTQGYLDKNFTSAYFKFEVDLQNFVDIEILLQGDIGKFNIYVSNDDNALPTKEKFFWNSNNNFILIPRKHESYRHKDVYNILVTPSSPDYIEEKTLNFGIMFATANTIKTLENNEPFYDSIPFGQSKSCVFFAHPGDVQQRLPSTYALYRCGRRTGGRI